MFWREKRREIESLEPAEGFLMLAVPDKEEWGSINVVRLDGGSFAYRFEIDASKGEWRLGTLDDLIDEWRGFLFSVDVDDELH